MTDKLIAALEGLLTLDELEFGDESVLEAQQPNHPLIIARQVLREAKRFTGAERHATALAEHYALNGIGPKETWEAKFKFWESQNPDGYSISHSESMTTQQKVWVFETSWLADQFPADYPHA